MKAVKDVPDTPALLVVKKRDSTLGHVTLHRKATVDDATAPPSDAPGTSSSAATDQVEGGGWDDGPAVVGLGMTFYKLDGKGEGRVIKRVKPGSAADLCGRVRAGDRCLSIDGVEVDGIGDLEVRALTNRATGTSWVRALTNRAAGTSAQVTFIPRKGGGVVEEVMLTREAYGEEGEEDALDGCGSEVSYSSSVASGFGESSKSIGLGLTFRSFEAAEGLQSSKSIGLGLTFRSFEAAEGLQVKRVKPGGASHAQIFPGDVVMAIDGHPVLVDNRAIMNLVIGPQHFVAIVLGLDNRAIMKLVIGPELSTAIVQLRVKATGESRSVR
ncbi:hypothetical protein T484DRAFT_1785535 [Baffinella frigidus]|nr:hypothetical protein T484DRAFT_1785535 [Cryptophyta sp. CCMP2293]